MDNKTPIVLKNPNHNNRQSLICVHYYEDCLSNSYYGMVAAAIGF